MQLETPKSEPVLELDDEDTEALLGDCLNYINLMVERKQPKWMLDEARALIARLDKVVSWVTVH